MSRYYKNILIYGTGYIASDLIDQFRRLNLSVIGVLDRIRIGGTFHGIPIMEWREVDEDMADVIFIAAPNKYCKEIYFRILPFCMAREIEILDAGGHSLTAYFGIGLEPRPYGYYAESYDEVIEQIDAHDVISFDIFDTLLVRDVIDPLDVFSYVESQMIQEDGIYKGFRKNRRTAELQCNYGNIDEIYTEIQKIMSFSDLQRDTLKRRELESEEELIRPRNSVVKILEYARTKGKRIIAVSDMYISENLLDDILKKNGIVGIEKIFVSCDYRKSKTNGLFEEVIKQCNTISIFHIGDNLEADVMAPRKLGIHSMGIMKTTDLLKRTPLGRFFGHVRTLADSLWMARIANEFFSEKLSANNNVKVDDSELFAKLYYSPLITLYLQELEKLLINNKYDGVLFVARDGYIFQKCYEMLAAKNLIMEVPSYYLLCSRKLAIKVGLKDEDELREVMDFFDKGSLSDTAKRVFDIDLNGFKANENIYNNQTLFDTVMKNTAEVRREYKSYLKETGIDINKNYLVCELDGHGTSVYYLNNLFHRGVDSFYFERMHLYDLYDLASTNIYNINSVDRQYSSTYSNLVILENLFTSSDPSVRNINGTDEFEYETDSRDRSDIVFLETIQDIAIKQVMSLFIVRKEKNIDNLSKDLVHRVFDTISEVELCGDCKCIRGWSLKDEMTGDILSV